MILRPTHNLDNLPTAIVVKNEIRSFHHIRSQNRNGRQNKYKRQHLYRYHNSELFMPPPKYASHSQRSCQHKRSSEP